MKRDTFHNYEALKKLFKFVGYGEIETFDELLEILECGYEYGFMSHEFEKGKVTEYTYEDEEMEVTIYTKNMQLDVRKK